MELEEQKKGAQKEQLNLNVQHRPLRPKDQPTGQVQPVLERLDDQVSLIGMTAQNLKHFEASRLKNSVQSSTLLEKMTMHLRLKPVGLLVNNKL